MEFTNYLTVRGTLQDAVLTGTQANAGRRALPDGWLTLAGPTPHDNGGRAALHVLVRVLDADGTPVTNYGPYYARASACKQARPNLRVYSGWTIQIVAAGSGSFPSGTQTARAVYEVSKVQPVGGPDVPDADLPGDCDGDRVAIQTADPAAGANPAQRTVGARSVERTLGRTFRLVTDATVGNRLVTVAEDLGVGDPGFAQVIPTASQGASLSVDYIQGARGPGYQQGTADALLGTPPDRVIGMPISGILLQPGDREGASAYGIQAGDNFGVVSSMVERWASLV